jgi:hypothetical protein
MKHRWVYVWLLQAMDEALGVLLSSAGQNVAVPQLLGQLTRAGLQLPLLPHVILHSE